MNWNYRIDDRGIDDLCALRDAAEQACVPLTWRRARCHHGPTLAAGCIQCDNGYCDDTHAFANLPEVATIETGADLGRVHLFALSDDHEWVACVTQARYNRLSAERALILNRVATSAALA